MLKIILPFDRTEVFQVEYHVAICKKQLIYDKAYQMNEKFLDQFVTLIVFPSFYETIRLTSKSIV